MARVKSRNGAVTIRVPGAARLLTLPGGVPLPPPQVLWPHGALRMHGGEVSVSSIGMGFHPLAAEADEASVLLRGRVHLER